MSEVFGQRYAAAYDALYADKDYGIECSILEDAWRSLGRPHTHEVLDLGCGTGRHSLILASRGYRVTGIDRSEAMLLRAREQASAEALAARTKFITADITEVDLNRTFDAVTMMFAVLGYQASLGAVRAAIKVVRRHLRPGGVFLFDVWYGPAVEAVGPSERVKTVPDGNRRITRFGSGTLDADEQVCTVRYRLEEEGSGAAHTVETHTVRYFFRDELRALLAAEDLDLLRLTAFPEVDKEPDASTWNVLGVARRSR